MTQKKQTARQLAESQIREELSKCDDRCFISFGTYVSNDVMLKIVQAALKEQREASKPKRSFVTSSWIKNIKFEYEDEYYYVTNTGGISRVYAFKDGILNTKEVLFEEETNPDQCMQDFIKYMDDMSLALDAMGGDWEG